MLVFAQAYSLLMYVEFFIGSWLRPHLTTYAFSHTIVILPVSLALSCAFLEKPMDQLPQSAFFFGLANWTLFNIFELGRKTFASENERNGVMTYSSLFGRSGAVSLVIVMSVLSVIALSLSLSAPFWAGGAITVGIVSLGLLLISKNTQKAEKHYQSVSSFALIFNYLFYIATVWIRSAS